MLDLLDCLNLFSLRIAYPKRVIEALVQCQIDKLVDRCAQNRTAMLAVVAGNVTPAPTKLRRNGVFVIIIVAIP